MKEKKGFTLVELLAVIVILAIVLIIAVPGVLSIINQTKDRSYESQLKMIQEASRVYVTSEPNLPWNDNQTIVNLTDLQGKGLLDQKLLDPRTKKVMSGVAVVVTKNGKQMKYDIVYTDASDANYPVYYKGMIPIVYDGEKWVKADPTNEDQTWFDYSKQQWANIATVKGAQRQALLDAPVGTEVPMDQINAMFVWLPRYRYKLWNVDGTKGPVNSSYLVNDYEIDVQMEGIGTQKSAGTQNGEWLTHPAFTFGNQELAGIWIGKFESGNQVASDATPGPDAVDLSKLIIKPNCYSWRGINFANAFYTALSMKTGDFGLELSSDTHMTKNMEWGAMAYLTNSRYGKTGNDAYALAAKEVQLNDNVSYLTGDGNYIEKVDQSTTGNITGIYDTAGGAWDYVASVMNYPDRLYLGNTTFTTEQLQALLDQKKYFDVYEYSTDQMDRSRGHLGDATLETGPFSLVDGAPIGSWYGDYSKFLYDRVDASQENNSFHFRRGVNRGNTTIAGIMAHHVSSGVAEEHGGFRITLV